MHLLKVVTLFVVATFTAVALSPANCTAAQSRDVRSLIEAGAIALKTGDLITADSNFENAVRVDAKTKPEISTLWRSAGETALEGGKITRAAAFFAKAILYDERVAPRLGELLLKGAATMDNERKRAGIVTRAIGWAGAEAALEASVEYYTQRLGPPRKVFLEHAGWTELATLQPGDEIHYLSSVTFRQKDAGTTRIMPPTIAETTRLALQPADAAGRDSTPVWLARHRVPTRVYIWLLPFSN